MDIDPLFSTNEEDALAALREAEELLTANVVVLVEAEGSYRYYHYRDSRGLPLCGYTGALGGGKLLKEAEGRPCRLCSQINTQIAKGW